MVGDFLANAFDSSKALREVTRAPKWSSAVPTHSPFARPQTIWYSKRSLSGVGPGCGPFPSAGLDGVWEVL